MESFEITINEQSFKVTRNSLDNTTFSVFNHATCHIIKKNEKAEWETIEHRFGTEKFPLQEVGEAIDKFYDSWQIKSAGVRDIKEA